MVWQKQTTDNRQISAPRHAEMVRGGGSPENSVALMPDVRMGPPPRSLAVDAHECIMVRIPCASTEYKILAACYSLRHRRLASDRLSHTDSPAHPWHAALSLGTRFRRQSRAPKGAPLRASGIDRSARPSNLLSCQESNGVPNEGLSKWIDERLERFALDSESPHTRIFGGIDQVVQ
jgi:hypothetical protein